MNKHIEQAQNEVQALVSECRRLGRGAHGTVRYLADQVLWTDNTSVRTLSKVGGKYIAVVDVAYEGQRTIDLGSSVKQAVAWFVARRAADLLEEEIANAG